MAYAWQCERCNVVVTPRGGLPPRFCPRCGERLAGAPVEAQSPVPTQSPYRPKPGGAIASLVLGIVALLMPGPGLLVGIVAIVAGTAATKRIQKSRGALAGEGLARAGVILGALAVVFSIMLCGRLGSH